MKQYESYTVTDFIQDNDFQAWVRGYSKRESFWLSFLQQYPEKQESFQQARQLIRAATVAPERINDSEIRREVEHFLEQASLLIPQSQPATDTYQKKNLFIRLYATFRWGLAVAAMLIALIGIGWYFFINHQTPTQRIARPLDAATNQLVETINHTQQPLRVILNDSSEVILSSESRLRYPAHFTRNARIVYLKGEGTFSVKHQNRPFMVYTGETVTKVLGTRFVVRAFDTDQNITVQVLSGKVQVYKAKSERTPDNKEVNGLILHANQAAIFEKSDGNLTKTLVSNPALVEKSRTKEAQFIYDEVALSQILRELEVSYGIPIQFDEQTFTACKITATLTNESLYEKLDLLCKAASATYEITDGQIVISRKSFR
ncbi:FecR family protein [Spirosoma validum]|uniref:FecR family protein n=1 Tax=Spirosoma validum TaxID=2771355 RepID=A0A927B1I5_9BACT|nr:FecR family protein [Spirosoma validum]MBD2753703.1 FecR family protein [Spirosoma validum]